MTPQSIKTKKKKGFIFHPLLIGLYPVLALLAYNIIQLDAVYAIRAIMATLLFSILIYGLSGLILRERNKAAMVASLFLFLFFTYGHVYNLLENKYYLGHHRFMVAIWLAILIIGIWGILQFKRKPKRLSTFLNYFAVVLIAIPLFQIAKFELTQTPDKSFPNPQVDQIWTPQSPAPEGSPDVYYIVMDAYTRSDKLKEVYGYDNTAFLEGLRDLGFYVAACSKSNYSYTPSSMAASFNMDYLDNFAGTIIQQNRSFYDLGQTIKHSKVRSLFSDLGYRMVTFDTDIWWLDITDSDQFISQYQSPWHKLANFSLLGNFEKYFIRTTALRVVEEYASARQNQFGKALLSTEKAHYDRIQFDFDQLAQLPSTESPKFVYAHLVAPHFPYVFNPDGSFQYSPSDNPGYVNGIQYVEKRMLEVLGEIIKNSETPPVILLQSDHGLAEVVRNANFMAYYMPNNGDVNLYQTITPVNSFRIVFNQYFGAEYPLLPDVARFASYQTPYDFTLVDFDCPAQ